MTSMGAPTEAQFMGRFQFLDAFRGFASLWIVSFHILSTTFTQSEWPLFSFFLEKGHLGTDIFFVISGFGVSAAVQKIINKNGSIWEFLSKRITRIYIVYLFSIIFVAIIIPTIMPFISALKGHPLIFEYPRYSVIEWLEISTLTKIFTAQSWELNNVFLPLNGAVWFIAIIVQIYIVVSLALLFRKNYNKVILIISVIACLFYIPNIKAYIPPGLFICKWNNFAIGILMYNLILNDYHIEKYSIIIKRILFTTLFFTLMLIILKYQHLFTHDMYRLLSSAFAGVLLWLIYPYDKFISSTNIFSLFKVIGLFSFSTYLLHVPLWPLVGMFVRNLVPLPEDLVNLLVLMPAVMFLCFLWYWIFERPGSFFGSLKAIYSPFPAVKSNLDENTSKSNYA